MANIFQLFDPGDSTQKDKGMGGDASLRYGVNECADQATAAALVAALAPLAVAAGDETLVRQAIKTKAITFDYFESEVTYGSEDKKDSEEPPKPGTWKFDFDTSGNKQTITSAPLVSRHWGSDFGEAPDLAGALNWDGQKVKGLEIPVANAKFSITQYLEARSVTPSLFRTYARATPRVNNDVWLGFQPGEVCYLGSKGQGDVPTIAGQRVQPIGIVHHFDASENQTNVSVEDNPDGGNVIDTGKYGPAAFDLSGASLNGQPTTGLAKDGWDYLWIWFKKRKDEDFAKVVPRPAYVYVHRPLKRMKFADFFGFGAGG